MFDVRLIQKGSEGSRVRGVSWVHWVEEEKERIRGSEGSRVLHSTLDVGRWMLDVRLVNKGFEGSRVLHSTLDVGRWMLDVRLLNPSRGMRRTYKYSIQNLEAISRFCIWAQHLQINGEHNRPP